MKTLDDYLTPKKKIKPEPKKQQPANGKRCSCGKRADIKTNTSVYCMDCWHNYPEGFMTRGWDFI
jgi:hypothetical protein